MDIKQPLAKDEHALPEQTSTRQTLAKDKEQITRRNFLHLMECMGVGLFLGWDSFAQGPKQFELPGGEVEAYRRYRGRVIHVHEPDAVSWDFNTGWYGYFVDQEVVDAMVEVGLMQLTQTGSATEAWRKLIPGYKQGKTFAIKVNFNNYFTNTPDPDPDINALIEPVNSIIKTLMGIGVAPEDVTVYDVTHGWHNGGMPTISFIDRCLYPGVNFAAYRGYSNPYSATEFVTFNPPAFPQIPDLALCNAVVNADYVINMPIPKEHSFTGVTLGLKNHMGSIDRCQFLHRYFPYTTYHRPDYNPLIDLYQNKHIGPKTVLTVGDFLFGNWYDTIGTPPPWITFNDGAPSSLLFASDVVAIDSVMTDFLEFERIAQGVGPVLDGTRDLFALAQKKGLGIHEKGDPWQQPAGSGYERIDYAYIDGI